MLVPLEVDELVDVTDALIVADGESVLVSLPVIDGPAPTVTEEVGDRVIDLGRLCVVDGVMLDVEVADDVPLPVGDIEAVAVADDGVIVRVGVALKETDGILLALPPILKVLVAVSEIVEVRLIVVDPLALPVDDCVGVSDKVLVPLQVPLPVGDTEAEALAVIVDDEVIVGVMVALNDKDGVPLAEAP